MAGDQIVQIKTLTHDGNAIVGVRSVSYDDSGESVVNRADDDIYGTAQCLVTSEVTGTIDGIDQAGFASLALGVSGALVVTGKKVSDGTTATLTISNVMLLGQSADQSHSDEGTSSITFKAMSSDGQASPIVYT